MSDEQREPGRGIYHIRVQGSLDGMPADRFDDLLVVPQANGDTRLVGPLANRAALHDLLGEIGSRERDLAHGWAGGLSLPQAQLSKTRAVHRMRGIPRRQGQRALLPQKKDQVGQAGCPILVGTDLAGRGTESLELPPDLLY